MPSISTGKVLVSGANGYVALWVIDSLLKRGFSVRGTVRSAKKSEHLYKLFESYGRDKLEIVVVEDITKEGAFDEAVQGVDAIMHTASPFITTKHETTVDEMVRPAVDGTVSILKSAAKYSGSIKRVEITSSVASVLELKPTPTTFTEEDWNTGAAIEIEKNGDKADAAFKYIASKVSAEKGAWDFYHSVKKGVSWDLVTICPALVFGPLLQEINSISDLNQSMDDFYKAIMSGKDKKMTLEQLLFPMVGWVDARDVAEAHTLALITEEAKDQRFLTVAEPCCAQTLVLVANKINPKIPVAFPEVENPPPFIMFDSSKSKKVLGLSYRSLEETTRDCLEFFEKRQWLNL